MDNRFGSFTLTKARKLVVDRILMILKEDKL